MNTRQKVLEEALKCVNGEREKQYGNPEDNFSRIADFWGLYLTTLFEDTGVVVELDPKDVAMMMVLFKIARSLGDQDKLDNYIDIIGYAACGAEIFEKGEARDKVLKKKEELGVQLADECKECDYAEKCIGTGVCLKDKEKEWIADCDAKKDKPDEKCNRKDCGQFDSCMNAFQHYIYNKTKEASEAIDSSCDEKAKAFDQYGTNILLDKKDPYSYAHDKLSNYVSVKAKEGHVPLDKLKEINRRFPRELSDYLHDAVNDCVENGKQFLDCYKEIDELFAKYVNKNKPDNEQKGAYGSFLNAYNDILTHIIYESSKANVHPFDVIDNLTHHDHAPTDMADLLTVGELGFDDVASYVDNAINELKKEETPKTTYKILKMTEDDKGVYLTVKEDKK